MADGCAMAIAVRRMPELGNAADVQLPAGAELGDGGWWHYGDCRAPEAGTGGCTAACRLPPPAVALRLLCGGDVRARLRGWWPGPARCGSWLADAAIRCELRGLNWLLRFNRPLGGPVLCDGPQVAFAWWGCRIPPPRGFDG